MAMIIPGGIDLPARSFRTPLVFGMGLRDARCGIHQIIPNRFCADFMYTLVYNHTPVAVRIDGGAREFPAATLCLWDMRPEVFYGAPGKPWRISWLQFFPAAVPSRQSFKKLGLAVNTPHTSVADCVVDRHFLAVYGELSENQTPDEDLLRHLLQVIFLEMRRSSSGEDEHTRRVPPVFAGLRRYIEEHYRQRLSLGELAHQAHLDPVYISRKFKEYYGCAPIEYALRLRLTQAAMSLKETTLSVCEIAVQAGYESVYHFSKIFKRRFGLSPRAFRLGGGGGIGTAEAASLFSDSAGRG